MRPSLFLLYATSAAAGLSVGAVLAGSGSGTSGSVTMGASNATAISGPMSLPPMRIQYTGKFFNNTSAPKAAVPNSKTNTIVFEIFDAPTGGTSLYGPEIQTVSTTDGVVNTVIGANLPMTPAQALAIAQAGKAYLQVTFDSEGAGLGLAAEVFPRTELTSSLFAIHSMFATDVPGMNITPNSVDTTGQGTVSNSVRTGNLVVTGSSNLANVNMSSLTVTGSTVFTNPVTFENSPVFNSGLLVGGLKLGTTSAPGTSDTDVTTSIENAGGNTLLIGDGNDAITIGGTSVAVNPAMTLASTLTVNSSASLGNGGDTITLGANNTDTLTVNAVATFADTATVTGAFTASGLSHLNGAVDNAFGQLNLTDNDGINLNSTGAVTITGTTFDVQSTGGITNGAGVLLLSDASGISLVSGAGVTLDFATTLNVSGATVFQSTIDAQGAINNTTGSDGGRVFVNDSLHVANNLVVDGSASQAGTLTLTGTPALDAQGDIVNTSGANGGAVRVNDTFSVANGTTLQALDVQGTVSNSGGDVTLGDNLHITGNTDNDGTFNSDGAATLQSTLAVTGATTLQSTLGVTGATTLNSTLDAQDAISNSTGNNGGDVFVNDGFHVTGNTDVDGTFNADGATTLGNTLNVAGATTLQSTLNVAGATTLQSTLDAQNSIGNSTGNNGGAVQVADDFSVTGNMTVAGTVSFTNTSNEAVEIRGGIFNQNSITDAADSTEPIIINDHLQVFGKMLVHNQGAFASIAGLSTSDSFITLPSNSAATAMAVDGSVQIGTAGAGNPAALTVEGVTILQGTNNVSNPSVVTPHFIDAQGGIQNSTGDVTIPDNVNISNGGNLVVAGTIASSGQISGPSLNISGAASVGSLAATTSGSFGSSLSVGTSLTVGTTATVSGLITGNAGLNITANGATITGATSINGATSVTGTFTQSGGANTFGGATTVNNTFTVGAFLTTLGGNLDVAGALSTPGGAALQINDDLQVNGTSDLRQQIQNLGAINSGRVFVNDVDGFGTSTTTPSFFGGNVQVGIVGTPATTTLLGTFTVGNNAAQFNNSTFNGSVTVTGDTGVGGGASVFTVGSLASTNANVPSVFNGNVNMNQVVVIGDNTNTPVNDSLTVNSAVITMGDSNTDAMGVNAVTTFANGATLTVNSDTTTIGNANTDVLNVQSATTFTGTSVTLNNTATLAVNSDSITLGNASTDAMAVNASTTFADTATLVVNSNNTTIGNASSDILTVNSTTTFVNNVTIQGDLTENGGTGALSVNGDVTVTGGTTTFSDTTVFTVNSNTATIGNANSDTLGIQSATTFTGTSLTTNDSATMTLNSNVVNAMDDAGDVWNWNAGTVTHADGTTLTVNSTTITLGNAAGDAMTVNATSTFNSPITTADAANMTLNSNTVNAMDDAGDVWNFNAGTVTHADGTTLTINSTTTTIGNASSDTLTINATTVQNGPTTFADAATLTINSNVVNAMDDAGDVWNFNAGTVTHADGTSLIINSSTTTIGNATSDSLTIGATTQVNGPTTFADAATLVVNSNSTTIGNASSDALTVNATTTFNANVTDNANMTVNGNTTLGDAAGDTLTVNATSTFNANLSANANVTLGNSPTDALQINAGTSVGNNGTGFGPGNFLPGNVLNVWGGSSFAGVMQIRKTSNGAQTMTFDGETGKITAQSLQITGQKNFISPNPADAKTEFVFVAQEGPEAGVYYRGKAELKKGTTRIELPETFALSAEADGLTANVTAVGKKASVWVVEQAPGFIVIGSDEDVTVNYRVDGVRLGFAGHEAKQLNRNFLPKTKAQVDVLPVGVISVLKKNGIVNADGTPNLDVIKQVESSK